MGFSTGARQYGYRTVPVPDPSGKKDEHGRPALLGKRIEVDEQEAKVIRRIFEWAADGLGLRNIVDRLNVEGVPGSGGKRWTKTPVRRILKNERYRRKAVDKPAGGQLPDVPGWVEKQLQTDGPTQIGPRKGQI